MKRIYYIMAALLFCAASINAQVRIGKNDDPHKGAILDLQFAEEGETENKGILLPRVKLESLSSFTIADQEDAIEGMLVYNIGSNDVPKGLYVWADSQWEAVGSGGNNGDGGGEEPTTPATELPKVTIISDIYVATISNGDPVELHVNVTTSGSNNYQWYKNGNNLDETGLTLSIDAIVMGDQYSCVVTNSVGSTTAYWSTCGAYISETEWLSFMCHNLGADESADPFTYSEEIFGDLYQWGRVADGHQTRSPLSESVSGPVNVSTYCDANDQVARTATNYYGKFIKNSNSPWDWRNTQNNNLWGATVKTFSDPCPEGWKVPTQDQWAAVYNYNTAAISYDKGLMIGNSLYLPAAGCRLNNNATVASVGTGGRYWSSTVSTVTNTNSFALDFSSATDALTTIGRGRADGLSVRCVADN